MRLAAELAGRQGRQADLTVANNVLAHVPDINDFVAGFAVLLKPQGVATFEFPHLLRLVAAKPIRHRSTTSISPTCRSRRSSASSRANGLAVFDVEELPTHGGSLRVFAQRTDTGDAPRQHAGRRTAAAGSGAGMNSAGTTAGFQAQCRQGQRRLSAFLLDAKRRGQGVAAYGAAAKGNTLMNYAGIRPDLIPFVVDRNPAKQGKFMPGSRIPIVDEAPRGRSPDFVILPWNLSAEVWSSSTTSRMGGRFVTAVPELRVT